MKHVEFLSAADEVVELDDDTFEPPPETPRPPRDTELLPAFESPEDERAALEALARRVMESAMALDVPLKVDIKTGADWAQA